MKEYRFGEESRADFDAALRHYREVRPELARDFYDEVESAIELACNLPASGSPAKSGLRFLLTKRFPYVIYYENRSDFLLIWAVVHGSRHPDVWKSRFL